MACGHKLAFRQTFDLIAQNYFKPVIGYTCDCGQKCELELNPLLRVACVAAAVIVIAVAEALLKHLYCRYYMVNVLLCAIGLCIGAAVWVGAIYGLYRLNAFKFTGVADYKPIVNRQELKKR